MVLERVLALTIMFLLLVAAAGAQELPTVGCNPVTLDQVVARPDILKALVDRDATRIISTPDSDILLCRISEGGSWYLHVPQHLLQK